MFVVSVLLTVAIGAAPPDSSAADRAARRAAPDTLPLRVTVAATVAASGDGRGQVLEPAGVAVDAFGRVYVSDAALHRLQRLDRDGRWLGESGVLGSGAGELRRPGSVVMLGALGVAVLDRENRRVQAYDLFGKLVGTAVDLADPALESLVGRVDPAGLAADRGGALYVADPARERVLVFDGSGRFLRALGGFGGGAGLLRGLRGLAAAPRGELVVTERSNARLQELDAGGRVVASWSLPLSARGGVQALPVAVDEHGRVAVADGESGKLWVFDAGGRPLAAVAGLGRPLALAFAPDGSLLVAGTAPPAVRRLTLSEPPAPTPAGGD